MLLEVGRDQGLDRVDLCWSKWRSVRGSLRCLWYRQWRRPVRTRGSRNKKEPLRWGKRERFVTRGTSPSFCLLQPASENFAFRTSASCPALQISYTCTYPPSISKYIGRQTPSYEKRRLYILNRQAFKDSASACDRGSTPEFLVLSLSFLLFRIFNREALPDGTWPMTARGRGPCPTTGHVPDPLEPAHFPPVIWVDGDAVRYPPERNCGFRLSGDLH